jgi:hypothetical protein
MRILRYSRNARGVYVPEPTFSQNRAKARGTLPNNVLLILKPRMRYFGSMKNAAPVFLALGTATVVLTTLTGIAKAPDVFNKGAVSLTPYEIAYSVAVVAFLISGILSSR